MHCCNTVSAIEETNPDESCAQIGVFYIFAVFILKRNQLIGFMFLLFDEEKVEFAN